MARLSPRQIGALRAALEFGKVSEPIPYQHQARHNVPRATLLALVDKGLLVRRMAPQYMPTYVLTDEGRAVATANRRQTTEVK